jgi:hypothetical protein
MASDAKPSEELNVRANQVVEQIKQQVLVAVDAYFNCLGKTISSYSSGGTDAGEKLKSYAEKNIAATHQFVHKLSRAEDFTEAVRLQTEFTQAQMSAFVEQIKGFSVASTKALAAAVKPPSSCL